jgi:hypothetical protein
MSRIEKSDYFESYSQMKEFFENPTLNKNTEADFALKV